MNARSARDAWYAQPLFWLGALILAASLAGCVWMILLAARHPDPPLETGQKILKMPATRTLPTSPSRSGQ